MEDERELELAATDNPFCDYEWYDGAKRLRDVYRQLAEVERELLYKYWYREDLDISFEAWFYCMSICGLERRRQDRAVRCHGRFGLTALLPDDTVRRLVREVALQVRNELDEGLRGAVWHAFAHGEQVGPIEKHLGCPPDFQLLLDAAAQSDWKQCPDCAELLVKTGPGTEFYSSAQRRLRGYRDEERRFIYYRKRLTAADVEVVEARARADVDRTESRR